MRFEGDSATLHDRLHLGRLLAIKGDPRIKAISVGPLCQVPKSIAQIGIGLEDVDAVVAEFETYGVLKDWILKEVPRHPLQVGPYQIAKYPVTNIQYLHYLLDNVEGEVPSSWSFSSFPFHKSNHPVYSISEKAAESYCKWLGDKTGLLVRLPTEAEWEFAAGASARKYPWGDTFQKNNCNTAELDVMGATPVGCFPTGDSSFGVSDMAGNVEEYCADDYAPYVGGRFIKDDLISDERPNYRVARGGCFGRFGDLARVSRRHGLAITPYASLYAAGLRIVVDPLPITNPQ
jgi:formylglycine-generating enzyme required for sulfatase activity